MSALQKTAFNANASLTRDFLAWLEQCPRTYAEVMEAWRTSCPRLPIWEDALADGFVQVESVPGTPIAHTLVRVTPPGRAALSGAPQEAALPQRSFT